MRLPSKAKRPGLTLIEVLICAVLMVVALIPTVLIFRSANRVSYSADRLLQATLHGEVVIESLAQLTPEEFPGLGPNPTPGLPIALFDDAQGGFQIQGNGTRWEEMVAFMQISSTALNRVEDPLASRVGKPFEMNRRIEVVPVSDDPSKPPKILIRISMEWKGLPTDPQPNRGIVLETLGHPALWQSTT